MLIVSVNRRPAPGQAPRHMTGHLMRRKNRTWTAAAALVLAATWGPTQAQAQTPSPPSAQADLPTRSVTHHESHVIASDGKTVSTYRFATQVLRANAVESAKQTTLSASRSAQQLDVLEAYTRKADGRRLPVPKSSWQLRADTGKGKNAPLFSDFSSTSLVFPDVAVGDTLVLAYRLSTREPLFPGKVSMSGNFPRTYAYDDVRISVDAPTSMALQVAATGMQEAVAVKAGRKITTWTLQHKNPAPQTRQNWSVFDVESEPGYRFSSFDSWADIGRSYVARASPKAAVTPRVKQLAAELTDGKAELREQVRALHEWVATKVDYAGNCVGIGAVVPRDLDVVLDHRIGDCKDHATLLQALLSAQGIESHQVLVNASNLYKLPAVPVASMVNHVINYIPALGLFVDSTDPVSPLGRLPMNVYQKPVLAAVAGIPSQTPADPGGHTQHMVTRLALAEDGSAEGEVVVKLAGQFALTARQRLKNLDNDTRARFVQEVFRAWGLEGEGKFEHADTAVMSDRFDYRARFKVKRAIRFPGAGAFPVGAWFYNEAPVAHFAQQAAMAVEDVDTLCSAGTSIEEYEITLPASMQVLSVPTGTGFNTALLGFESSYAVQNQVLKARRELQDRTPASVCSAQTQREFKAAAEGVLADQRQQLLYK
jgi:hypothetical protein